MVSAKRSFVIPSRRMASFAAAALALAPIAEARANGRFPAANQVVHSPTDPNFFVLRTTFGLLVTHDAGITWDWVCESAVGYAGTLDPPIGLMNGRNIVVAGEGLMTSSNAACDWAFVPSYEDLAFADVVVHPDAPSSAIALQSNYRGADDAGAAVFDDLLVGTTDDGAHWAPLGPALDQHLLLETVEVARSDPKRVYVSGFRGAADTLQAFLLVSNDNGATWAAKPVPLDPATERTPFISAVDPANANRIYVRTGGGKASRLLVTDDAGDSFRSVFEGPPMLGFALTDDGAKVYVGGTNGLFEASTTDLVFHQKSSIQVQCLTSVGPTLYACSNEESGFVLGASTDDGATFKPLLHLKTVRGPLSCAAGSSAATCADSWPALRDTFGITSGDAGSSGDGGTDAGADAGAVPPATSSSGCGCTAATSAFPTGLASIGLLVGAAALRRRRRA